MIVVFPFCHTDQDLAAKNACWMTELGGCKGHSVLVVHDKRCNPGIVESIRVYLSAGFDHIWKADAPAEIDGWPMGANYFFRVATTWLQNKPEWPYFFWLEPDAIMLLAGALDAIQAEFERSKMQFMGDRVEVEDIPLHMSGVGIYSNPIHKYAGECYRALEVAFDMVARDQIVPRAHFTKLIEHAWKHPKFTSIDELQTQIRKECVIFHSSKDGSLIDLLRQKMTAVPAPGETLTSERDWTEDFQHENGRYITKCIFCGEQFTGHKRRVVCKSCSKQKGGDAVCPATAQPIPRDYTTLDVPLQPLSNAAPTVQPAGAASFSCDIFIRTYEGDYQWLEYCLRSIEFCSGFRKIWIVSPDNPPVWMLDRIRGLKDIKWKQLNEECDDHYLSQQIHKLYADVITDYQADFILHIDSDTVFTRPVTPRDFVDTKDRVIWPYTPYNKIETPWQPIIEKFMCRGVENEFMRRFPIMVPKWLYPKLREFCYDNHSMIISTYIKNQPLRSFSEFNALGAYAWVYHRDKFHWLNTATDIELAPFARQFFSWGGITPEVQQELDKIFGGGGERQLDGFPTSLSEVDKLSETQRDDPPLSFPLNAGETISPKVTSPTRERPDSILLPNDPAPSVNLLNLRDYIDALRDFAYASKGNRIRVGQQLARVKLK